LALVRVNARDGKLAIDCPLAQHARQHTLADATLLTTNKMDSTHGETEADTPTPVNNNPLSRGSRNPGPVVRLSTPNDNNHAEAGE
jgi:hypothetical protein